MVDVCITKIPLENLPGESIAVYSTWADKSFSVNVFHKDRAWHKSVSEDDLKFLSDLTCNSMEEYLKETKRALTCDGGSREFTYSFRKAEFIWKKLVDPVNDIKVKFGSFLLEEMPVSTFAENAVNFLLNRCSSQETMNNSLKKENEDLKAANAALRTHVVSITKLKTEMEEALYTKFLAVLNAKKEKIYELQEYINAHPSTSGTTESAGHKSENIEKDHSWNKESDPYGSETEVDTDESGDYDHSKRISSTPSTSMVARIKEEKDSFPMASKTLKLDDASPGSSIKSPVRDQDDDVDDIFVPARRKKSVKSGISRL